MLIMLFLWFILVIVAFEQNMLEFCIIERDYIKIMSVLLTIVKQVRIRAVVTV